MKSFIEFNKKMLGMKFPWNYWMGLLILINIGGGLYYVQTIEGQLALVCMMVAFLIMWGIFVKRGFVRLLGIGHLIAWTPQVVWYTQMVGDTAGWFYYWLMSAIVFNGLCLVIDMVDVVRYSMGDKQPIYF